MNTQTVFDEDPARIALTLLDNPNTWYRVVVTEMDRRNVVAQACYRVTSGHYRDFRRVAEIGHGSWESAVRGDFPEPGQVSAFLRWVPDPAKEE